MKLLARYNTLNLLVNSGTVTNGQQMLLSKLANMFLLGCCSSFIESLRVQFMFQLPTPGENRLHHTFNKWSQTRSVVQITYLADGFGLRWIRVNCLGDASHP